MTQNNSADDLFDILPFAPPRRADRLHPGDPMYGM